MIAADLAACPMCFKERGEVPTITSGGASNAGEELEAQAAAAVEAGAAPVPADAEVSPAEGGESDGLPTTTGAPDVASMSKAELQDHADSLGLPISGSKAELAARIVEHHEAAAADEPPPTGPDSAEPQP